MRVTRIAHWSAAIAVVAAIPVLAVAGPSIRSGGPGAKAERARLERALGEVAGAVAVCWRGERPAAVEVTVSVGADGTVEQAKARTRGKVATCAAAVLAVQRLAPARKRYQAVVAFDTGSADAGGGDRDAVMTGLRGNRALRACYEGRAELRGELQLRFLVKPTGRVVDAEVVSSSVDAAVQRCLLDALGEVRLEPLSGGKTIEFVLPFRFDGAGAAGASGGDAALQPQKSGPLEADVLTRVMNEAKPRFGACYEKRLAAKPELAGDVVLRYTVRADGKPHNVKIKQSTLGDPVVEQCMVAVGEKLRFPASAGRKDTRVIYPFRFARP